MGIKRWASDIFDNDDVVKLIRYVRMKNEKGIKEMIESGVDINYKGYKNITPLYFFFMEKDYPSFKKMLEIGANPNVSPDGLGLYSLLNFSMQRKDDRYFKTLLEYKVNINHAHNDEPPLAFALYNNIDIKYLRMLIEHKVNPYYYDKEEDIQRYWSNNPLVNTVVAARGYLKAILLLEYYPDYLKDERIKKIFIREVKRHGKEVETRYRNEQLELIRYLKEKFDIETHL